MTKNKYQILADDLADAILSKKLAANARLPSVRELMQQHQLSLATVTNALHTLEEKGLVEPRGKAGYFVKPPAKKETTATAPHTQADLQNMSANVLKWGPAEDLFPERRWQSLLGSVIRRHPFLSTRHAQAYGHPRLRAELAKRSAENGCFLKEDELIVTQGATEALLLALRATSEAGSKVLVQAPVSVLYSRLLETFTLTPVTVHSSVDAPEFLAEVQAILEGEDPPKVFLLVANYHFPTGALMPLPVKRNLLRLAEKHGVTIIEDDVYGDLQHDGARPLTLKSFDLKGKVIYVNSCSKTLAPGLRIGWLAAGSWRERIEYLKSASASSVNELSQLVLAEFLAQGSHVPHLRKYRQQLKSRSGEYLSILRLVLGNTVKLADMPGGYSYWLPLPGKISTEEIQTQIRANWPLLDEADTPQIALVSNGVCVNTSIPLTDSLRQSLTAFCFYLRGFY
ncbi:PLP-dependent aminotransferase family protein [Undibacterium sp. KW1]|uniref:aminotransferase-like domain-containing protein n=1 Tax=Undibacterium sp. KW1 TaxID=2058624 RepID=UPI001389ABD2|nr:PLP-dependent aminotransferase family protein [Undibacterium sp. KW1]